MRNGNKISRFRGTIFSTDRPPEYSKVSKTLWLFELIHFNLIAIFFRPLRRIAADLQSVFLNPVAQRSP